VHKGVESEQIPVFIKERSLGYLNAGNGLGMVKKLFRGRSTEASFP
jgi:hypothetical protein